METEISKLQSDLATSNEQLNKAEALNQQLCEQIKTAMEEKRLAIVAYNEITISFEHLKQENQKLKKRIRNMQENLFNKKLENHTTINEEDIISCQSNHFGCDKLDENHLQLKKQVTILTEEKKELLTHLHWLSRRQTALECMKDLGAHNAINKLSLEEGNRISNSAMIMTESCPLELDGCFEEAFGYHESNGCYSNLNLIEEDNRAIKTEQLMKRLKRLQEGLSRAVEMASSNNTVCDLIFKLCFRNLRHPYEPQSYSRWQANHVSDSACQKSLEGSRKGLPNVIHSSIGNSSISLESYPFNDFYDRNICSKAMLMFSSSPEIFSRNQELSDISGCEIESNNTHELKFNHIRRTVSEK